jgi:hypothetical protein
LFSISLFPIEKGPNSPSFCKLPVYSFSCYLIGHYFWVVKPHLKYKLHL